MSIITTYTCDRCGHSQVKPDQMWHVGVSATHVHQQRSEPRAERVWCRKCCDEFQIIGAPEVDKAGSPIPVVTFEDKLRELVREEIDATDR